MFWDILIDFILLDPERKRGAIPVFKQTEKQKARQDWMIKWRHYFLAVLKLSGWSGNLNSESTELESASFLLKYFVDFQRFSRAVPKW